MLSSCYEKTLMEGKILKIYLANVLKKKVDTIELDHYSMVFLTLKKIGNFNLVSDYCINLA